MQLGDIMTRDVEVIAMDASLREAAAKMKALDVGLVPICDGETLKGTLTDRDITIRVTAEGRDPQTTAVRDVMSQPVVTVRPQQDVLEAEQLMHDHQIRRLPVVEQDGRLVGYVTTATIAKRDADEKVVGKVLKGISQPQKPEPEKISPSKPRKTGS